MASPPALVPTRILVVSDTHAHASSKRAPPVPPVPPPAADVALHCGDLTRHGHLAEYERAFVALAALDAPLKLVIPGNHDAGLDAAYAAVPAAPGTRARAVWDLAAAARYRSGVHVLAEGVHGFALANGARLTLYATPYTPRFGSWSFQYVPGAHAFDMPPAAAGSPAVDVVMSHGPPRGILDLAGHGPPNMRQHSGCDVLLRAVAAARPQLHCFGHIHEAWGACLGTWDAAAADADAAPACRALEPRGLAAAASPAESGCAHVDLAAGETRLERGRETLFVNAANMNIHYRPSQPPWLVDLHLPAAAP